MYLPLTEKEIYIYPDVEDVEFTDNWQISLEWECI